MTKRSYLFKVVKTGSDDPILSVAEGYEESKSIPELFEKFCDKVRSLNPGKNFAVKDFDDPQDGPLLIKIIYAGIEKTKQATLEEYIDAIGSDQEVSKAEEILHKCKDVLAQRGVKRDSGQERSMQRIVNIYNAWTGNSMTPEEGYRFMVALKLGREIQGKVDQDDYIDAINYLALLGEELC